MFEYKITQETIFDNSGNVIGWRDWATVIDADNGAFATRQAAFDAATPELTGGYFDAEGRAHQHANA